MIKEIIRFLESQGLKYYEYGKSDIETVYVLFDVLNDIEDNLLRASNSYAKMVEEKSSTEFEDLYSLKCHIYRIIAENLSKIF